ncbi:MAG: DUF3857 domain-containing protein [Candidatus Omnitrophota bacterium]|nr:MAG: DUF3857 domain-containing protein [Candidatus Omnitrophota bacterium]
MKMTMIKRNQLESILFCCWVFAISCLLHGCSPSLEKFSSRYKKITHRYEEMLKAEPTDEALRLKLAEFYYTMNDYQKIKNLLQESESRSAKVLFAKACVHLKEYTLAYETFEQLGPSKDNEYLYLYAQTLEEKNLFPRAITVYKKVEPPLKKLAQQRIKEIGIKIEEGVPVGLQKLLGEEEEFLSRIEKEEAVVLFVDEEIEIKENNTSIASLHVVEKVLKEKGKRLGEVTIGYDSTHERVELEYARTITPEGKVVYVGKENIRDVSKYLNYPLYSNARAFIISMPSVEVGSIVEYKAKIYSSQLINDDDFTFLYRLQEGYPIVRASFRLSFPKNRDVQCRFINEQYAQGINLDPTTEERQNKRVYSWEFRHIPALIPEDKMPPRSYVNPAILISSFSSWKEIYSWWHELFQDKLALTEEIKKFLADLIKDCKTDYEKAKKIYEFCSQEIRYVGVEYGESGYEPHHAKDVFWNRYGDCKDKATLLVAMLREAGMSAFPVLIPTREVYSIDENFASVNFNHAIAAFQHNDQILFMDATSSTTAFSDLPLGDQEREVLIFFDDGYKIMSTPLLEENEVVYTTYVEIDNNEDAKITRKITTKGFYATFQRFYFKYSHPQEIEDNIQNKIVEISPFSKLVSYKIENVDDYGKFPTLEYSFVTSKILNPAKNLRIFPDFGDIGIDTAYAGKKERIFPVEFEGIFRKVSRVEVRLPPHLKVKYLPPNQSFDTEWFTFKAVSKKKKNAFEFYQEFAVRKRFVAKEDYKKFKKNLEKVFYLLSEKVILAK